MPLLPTVPIPPPARDQVQAGCVLRALPNWSLALAANCWVPPLATVALPGVTATLVRVWLTVTLMLLVTVRPAVSLIVARKV